MYVPVRSWIPIHMPLNDMQIRRAKPEDKPMNEGSTNRLIQRVGYGGRVTGHGFRHTMSTILHDLNFESSWIEAQLAHIDKNHIRGIYNHAIYLSQRKDMMQSYTDIVLNFEKEKV